MRPAEPIESILLMHFLGFQLVVFDQTPPGTSGGTPESAAWNEGRTMTPLLVPAEFELGAEGRVEIRSHRVGEDAT